MLTFIYNNVQSNVKAELCWKDLVFFNFNLFSVFIPFCTLIETFFEMPHIAVSEYLVLYANVGRNIVFTQSV